MLFMWLVRYLHRAMLYERAHIRIRDMSVTIQTKVDTRERIVDAARKLFHDKGFERAATRDIAPDAGLAR